MNGGTPAPAPSAAGAFPTFGVTVTPPPDARFELTEVLSHIGFYRFGPTSPNAGAGLLLEIAPARGKSAADFADHFVTKAGASMQHGLGTIGGEPAAKVTARFNRETFTHRLTYFVVHGPHLYMFSALTRPGTDASGLLDSFVQSVKFTPIDSPTAHLAPFAEKPFSLYDHVTIGGPACLRHFEHSATGDNLEIHDYTLDDTAFMVQGAYVATTGHRPFTEIEAAYAAGLEAKFSFPEHLKWQAHPKVAHLFTSQALATEITAPGQAALNMVVRYCILDMGDGRYLQILFSIPNKNAADVAAYTALSDRMLDTVHWDVSGHIEGR